MIKNYFEKNLTEEEAKKAYERQFAKEQAWARAMNGGK